MIIRGPPPPNETCAKAIRGAGRTLTASVQSTADLALWLMDGCVTRCCFAGADVETGGSTETLTWTNPNAADMDVYLWADSFTPNAAGGFILTVSIPKQAQGVGTGARCR